MLCATFCIFKKWSCFLQGAQTYLERKQCNIMSVQGRHRYAPPRFLIKKSHCPAINYKELSCPKSHPSEHPHPWIGSGRVTKFYGPILDTLMGNTFSRAFHWVVLSFLRSPSQLDVFLYSAFLSPSSIHKC